MDFFEKLGKKATETYKSAAEKTNKIANDTKLKLKISDNKSKITDLYEEIGKKVYQKFDVNEDINIKEDVIEELEKIKTLTEEIKQFEQQRLELNDLKQCIQCKNKIERAAKFCPICGTEQPEEKEEILEAEVVEEVKSEEPEKQEKKEDVEIQEQEENNEQKENNE